jgi:hypothetical protein
MKWRNESPLITKLFRDIEIGEVFEFNEIFYIKITPKNGFDIINNITDTFDEFDAVILHDHEIVIL